MSVRRPVTAVMVFLIVILLGSIAFSRLPVDLMPELVYPTLTERTRTLRVRMSAANAGGALRPGLYGTATLESAGENVITVPRDAVVDTGTQQHVFVAVDDRFEPRPVTVGMQLADRVEIRAGLEEGEQIVAAGVFLLDSESRLRATGGAGGHNHGTPQESQPPAANPAPDPHAGHEQSSADLSAPAQDPRTGYQTTTLPQTEPHAGHRLAAAKPADKE